MSDQYSNEGQDLFDAIFGGTPTNSDFDLMGLVNSLAENDMAPTANENPYQLGFVPGNNVQGHIYQLFMAYLIAGVTSVGRGEVNSFDAFGALPEFSHILENVGIARETVLGFASRMIGGFLQDEAKDMLPEMIDELSSLLDEGFRNHAH